MGKKARLLLVGFVAVSTKRQAGGKGGTARVLPAAPLIYLPTCLIAAQKGCSSAAPGWATRGVFSSPLHWFQPAPQIKRGEAFLLHALCMHACASAVLHLCWKCMHLHQKQCMHPRQCHAAGMTAACTCISSHACTYTDALWLPLQQCMHLHRHHAAPTAAMHAPTSCCSHCSNACISIRSNAPTISYLFPGQ